MHPNNISPRSLTLLLFALMGTGAIASERGPSFADRAALAAKGAHLVRNMGETPSLEKLKCNFPTDTAETFLKFFKRDAGSIAQYGALTHENMVLAVSSLASDCDTKIKPNMSAALRRQITRDTRKSYRKEELTEIFIQSPAFAASAQDKSEGTISPNLASSVSSPALFGLQAGSAILEGIADFLVDRAKAEMSDVFLRSLTGESESKEDADTIKKFLRGYMSSSFSLLSQSSELPPALLIPQLKNAIRQDFRNLPSVVSEKIPDEKPYALMFRTGVRIGTSVREGESPITAMAREINLMAPVIESRDPRLYQASWRVAMLAQVYREDNKAIEILLDESTGDGRWYLGYYFLTAQIEEKKLHDSVWQSGLYREWFVRTHDVLTSIRNLQTLVDTLRSKDPAGLTPADYAKVLGLTARLTTTGLESLYGEFPLPDSTRRALRWFRTAVSLHEAVSTKDYYQVLQLTLGVLDSLKSKDVDTALSKASTRKYLSFAAALATTDSAAQVNRLLESVAAPVGSYRAKRTKNSGFSVLTINSYLGVAVGSEKANNEQSITWSPAAPIGIELTLPAFLVGDNWSIGVFVPVIDVGLLASRRIEADPEIDQDAEVGFAQVLSPGAFLMLGISSSVPLSIGGGYRYIPQLREGSEGQLSVRRWEVLVAIDLPIFQL